MLNNLKDIYAKGHATDKCLSIVDMMLLVDSEDLVQFRDRGLLRLQLSQFEGAWRDLEYYLKRIRAMMN
jgi:regulator of sirC expression with transglutaminase-like and TPR domain